MGATNRYDILAIVLVFMLAIFLENRESFSMLEDETLSYRQIARTYMAPEEEVAPIEDVVLIYTDEAFFVEYDKFPLRRVDLSTIIARLKSMGAAVIGVDMLLDFNSAYGEDPSLVDALVEAGNVLMVSTAEMVDEEFVSINKSIPKIDEVTISGYSNISSNSTVSEKIVRLRVYPDINESIGEWPFSVRAVIGLLGIEPEEVTLEDNVLSFAGDLEVQLDQFNDLYIDFPLLPHDGSGGTVKLHEVIGISAADILFAEDEEELEDLAFLVEGRIVLIGEVAEVAHDEFETPLGNVFGVEIIASTIATILNGGPLKAASTFVEIAVALVLMLSFIATRNLANPLPRNMSSILILAIYIVGVFYVYVNAGLVLSISYMLIASILSILFINARFYLTEMGQKAQIRDAFGQYLSPDVVADLVKDPEKLSLGGEEREMTAFFSDIAGFSTFSENMTPSELVHVLNDYLTEMCNIIFNARGTVDKFEGDAIIAFWGAPAIQEDHAKLACLATIDMNHALVPLRERWAQEGRPAIKVRMGLNSGTMVVGNMGSAQRMDYTMMGDAVNLAARLEGANKAYGSDLMISEATYKLVKDDVDVRELDVLRVVGKSEPVRVYQLLDRKDQTEGLISDMVIQFDRGMKLYRDGNYKDAMAAFRLALAIAPKDGPSETYIARCGQFIATPPPANWDGIFNLDSKG
ncbi:MAG: adenylate/guanylate cyclase domain-containing protein [Pseudomonadales bacterium]